VSSIHKFCFLSKKVFHMVSFSFVVVCRTHISDCCFAVTELDVY